MATKTATHSDLSVQIEDEVYTSKMNIDRIHD